MSNTPRVIAHTSALERQRYARSTGRVVRFGDNSVQVETSQTKSCVLIDRLRTQQLFERRRADRRVSYQSCRFVVVAKRRKDEKSATGGCEAGQGDIDNRTRQSGQQHDRLLGAKEENRSEEEVVEIQVVLRRMQASCVRPRLREAETKGGKKGESERREKNAMRMISGSRQEDTSREEEGRRKVETETGDGVDSKWV